MSNSNISPNQTLLPDNSTLKALFSLTATDDLSDMLHSALKILVKLFHAQGGSLFFLIARRSKSQATVFLKH